MATRLLLVSFVVPGEKNGGGIVFQRHLCRDSDIEVCVAPPNEEGWLARRLRKTRLSRLLNDLNELRPIWPKRADRDLVREFRPDAIVTVGQHTEYRRALGLARLTGLPLITFFHDLWPTMIKLSAVGRWGAWRGFNTLVEESALALCVSKNMYAELGRPKQGRILLPVPGPILNVEPKGRLTGPLRVGYSGSLFDYGPSIGEVAHHVVGRQEISLTVRGRDPNWSAERLDELTKAGIFQPPLDRDAFETWMASQDAHLCTLVFDAPHEPFVRTSFPSKLLEMLRFGRPVVLWGPAYAAGVQWALEHDAALVITSEDPADVADALTRLRSDQDLYNHYEAAAQRASKLVSYEALHQEFRSHLNDTIGQRLHKADPASAKSANGPSGHDSH